MKSSRVVSVVLPALIVCLFGIAGCGRAGGTPAERVATAKAAVTSFVQGGDANPPTLTDIITVDYNSAQTAADLNIVVVGWCDATNTTTVTAVTDKAGNAYTLAIGPTAQSGFCTQSTYYAKNISASSANAVTVKFSATTGPEVRISEYSGINTSSPLDATAASNGQGLTATTGPLTTTQGNDLVFVADLVSNCASGPSSGFNDRDDTGCDLVEDTVEATAGSYSASVTQTGSGAWVQQMLAFKAAGSGQPTFVQANGYPEQAVSSMTIPLASAQTAGDLIVVVVGWSDITTTVSSITDSAGDTYALAVGPTGVSGFWSQSIYYAKNIAGASSNVVTVTFSAATLTEIRVLEYSGLDPNAPLDTTAANTGQSVTATTGPISTSQANELVLVANLVENCVATPSSGFTDRDDTGCDLVEDNIEATTGSYSAIVTQSDSGNWVQQMVAFKPATGGPPPAPPIDQTVASNIATTTSFLYTGSNPVQTGVAAGTIVATRAAVVRGRVLNRNSQAISGAVMSVVGHPEFGSTVSANDGTFAMAVNGGSGLIVNYTANGFLPVQRSAAAVPWNDYAVMPDVVLTPEDSAATTVNLNAPTTYQVARANTVSDSSGTRTATLLIPPGTQAQLNGAAVSTLTVHATEYTVGDTGPLAMPGTLPANSGYTYAVEFGADEEGTSGRVQFNPPIVSYTDNFLHFTAGEHVPVGSYDRTTGTWVPLKDGLVITIVSITNGSADIDITGDGVADPPSALSAVGITSGEQVQLASMYPSPPKSLWRVNIPHFSDPYDFNWPYGPPPDAGPPPGPDPGPGPGPGPGGGGGGGGSGGSGGSGSGSGCGDGSGGGNGNNDNVSNGSRIECPYGILHESIPIAGTPYNLVYSSDRVAGYKAQNHLIIPLSAATVPSGLVSITSEVDVAGRSITQSFAPNPNQTTTFDWDGKDTFGRPLQGSRPAIVSVGYTYQGVYLTPSENPNGAAYDALFGHFSYYGSPATGDRARQQVTIWERTQVPLGHWGVEALGLGGWMLDVQQLYDSTTATLLSGNGDRQPASAFGDIITTVAGNGTYGAGGYGGPATSASLAAPWDVIVGPDGVLYISDKDNSAVRKVDNQGIITTVATGFSFPESIAVAPDGTVYVDEPNIQTIARISPTGTVTTYAGTGAQGHSGDNGPATSATLNQPNALLLAPDGTLYFCDTALYGPNQSSGTSYVRKIDPTGIISTIAGAVGSGYNGDNIAAATAELNHPQSLALSKDGALYIADRFNHRIRKIGIDGIITTVAGTGAAGFSGDGGPATQAQLNYPQALAFLASGTLYVLDHDNYRIRAISPDGTINTVAGTGVSGFAGDGGPALDAKLNPGTAVSTMGFDGYGGLYIGDGSSNHVRRLSLTQPGFTNALFSVAARNGSKVYAFDVSGRHIATKVLPTGGVSLTLGYDSAGHIATLTDIDGNVTSIQRDASENPTAVVSQFGVTTTLGLGSDGYLANVTEPTGASYQMAYQSGLLTSIQFPTGSSTVQSTKTYDSLGRLASSTDAAGHARNFSRATDAVLSSSVTKTTSAGVSTQYAIALSRTNTTTWTTTLPDGTALQQQLNADGSRTVTAPDGTKTTYTPGPDPRFGMQVPITAAATVATPSGLTRSTSATRAVTLSNPTDPLSLISETDTTTTNSQTWTMAFNASSRTWTTTSPVGRQSTRTVDVAGRLTSSSVPNIASLSISYDSHGRLSSMTQGSRTWNNAYDSQGYLASATDPLSHTVSYTNDAAGRPTQTVLADSRVLRTTNDGDGNPTLITLPSNNAHAFSFTPVDELASYTPPNLSSGATITQYTYDSDGRISQLSRPDGVTMTYEYDSAGRLTGVTIPQGTLSRTYNPTTGTLGTLVSPGGETVGYSYDGFLRTGTTWSGPVAGSLSLGFDNFFRVTSQTVNSQAIALGYDADSLLTSAGSVTVTRDPQNGRITGTTLGSVTDTYSYDSNGFLSSYTANYNGSAIYTESVVRDVVNRITQKTETIGSEMHVWGYTFDAAGRLTDVTKDGSTFSHYGYDADDNRTTFTNSTGTTSPTYDSQDRLLTYGIATYAYTANGDLTSKTVGTQATSYTYDAFGNLLHVGLPSVSAIDYVIDGENRRVGKKVGGALNEGFLYQDVLNIVAQLDGNGNVVARFVFATKSNVPDYYTTSSGTFRILSDHLGSPRLIVNTSTGTVVERVDYDEFGNITQDTSPGTVPFGFAGGLYDKDTGLVRFGSRDYDPSVGRWTTKDPTRFDGRQLNFYAYANNDPVNAVDPTGTDLRDCLMDALTQSRMCQGSCSDNDTLFNRICGWIGLTQSLADCLQGCLTNYLKSDLQCYMGPPCTQPRCLAMNP
jgi:RHS repeat-associated protein